MDIASLIQRLQAGEAVISVRPDGTQFTERRPPTSIALQAARTLQQLIQAHEGNIRVIQQLNKDIESLHEQIQHLQSDNTSGKTS